LSAESKVSGWSRSEFARIARDVEGLTGIVFPVNRIASSEAGMLRAMSKLRITNAVSLELAVSKPGPARDALMAELTIGESYFFREPAQLRFFADDLLSEWNESWPAERRLRVLSAGCAGGQEPYSIAIALHEKKWKRPSTIVGTDLSESRLSLAREATFSKWSLRTMPEDRISRWFRRDGVKYKLDWSIARDVEFTPMNLAAAFPPQFGMQDAIFCRNVLIYFDIATIKQIAERLLAALSPDGWLFLGASDPHIADLTSCEAVVLPGATAYRRCAEDVSGYSLRNAPLTLIEPIPDAAVEPIFLEMEDDVIEGIYSDDLLASSAEPSHGGVPTTIEEHPSHSAAQSVRVLANQGLLFEAGQELAAALEKYPESAELHLLESILQAEAGRWKEAERAARRALYLDRTLTLAHVALGDALGRKGDSRGARRNFESAKELIASAERRGDPVDTDGVPLARLMHIVRAHLSALGT
jgi:chemotaxis protein methyltransferase CheR